MVRALPCFLALACAADLSSETALADDDGDGLSNAAEAALGTDAARPDTDADGLGDAAEAGDTDGDGLADALEHSAADEDLDCLPDPLDPRDAGLAAPGELLALHCPTQGLCASAVLTVACEAGVPRCIVTATGYEAVESTCDGEDNDCDGFVDESTPLGPSGAPCVALGACGAGSVECDSSGGARCSTAPGGSADAATAESCNGQDDDCDGLTDEGLESAVGATCEGTGVCGDGVIECRDGQVRCSAEPGGTHYIGLTERCNGLDDDCNGLTDEDFGVDGAAVGAPCGAGVCAGGTVACVDGDAVCSTGHLAGAESCNGHDDDCDGAVDEPEELDVSDAGCPTLGVCAGPDTTVAVCAGGWSCVPGPTAGWGDETCDNLDNDCDGPTDEAFSVLTPDLASDAKPLPVGSPCGTGRCAGGTVTCAEGGAAAHCSTAPLSAAETCNGEDDDCDGLTDEDATWGGLPLGAQCVLSGPCGVGTVVCAGGVATCSSGGAAAGPELCNAIDDDCDGSTDELAEVAANTPDCPALGVCAEGAAVTACVAGTLVCDPSTSPAWAGPEELACDGEDEDCDGLIDEHLRELPTLPTVPIEDGEPPPRPRWPAAWDASQRLVVVGGGAANDAWRLETHGWRRLTDVPGPLRAGASVLRGPSGRILVVGGGPTTCARLDEDAWHETPLPPAVAARADAAAVADPASGLVWLFGGEASGAELPVAAFSEGGEALPLTPAGPGWLVGAAAALLEAGDSRGIALFGGALDGALTSRLWLLDLGSSSWTPVDAAGPPPRRDAALVAVPGGVVLHGGSAGGVLSDTWLLDPLTLTWTQLPDGPAMAGHAGELLGGSLELIGAKGRFRMSLASPGWVASPGVLLPPPTAGSTLSVRPDGTWWLQTPGGLWRRTPTGWAKAAGAVAPPPLPGAAAAADAEGLWLHGGGPLTNGLWRYDGVWTLIGGAGAALTSHQIVSDPGKARLIAWSKGEVSVIPKAGGPGPSLLVSGDAPAGEDALWLAAPHRDSAILAGPGGVSELDYATWTWRTVPTPSCDAHPTAWVLGDALWVVRAGELGRIDLDDGGWETVGAAPALHRAGAAVAVDPWLGRAVLVGGLDLMGIPRNAASALPFACE